MTKQPINNWSQLISSWLSIPENRDHLTHHSSFDDPNSIVTGCFGDPDMTKLQHAAKMYDFRNDCTAEELEQHIWDMWCDASQWEETVKVALGDNYDSYLTDFSYPNGYDNPGIIVPYFCIDMCGDLNDELVSKYSANGLGGDCILRTFEPNNHLANDYRLEVITTPDDSEIIGWTVIVD